MKKYLLILTTVLIVSCTYNVPNKNKLETERETLVDKQIMAASGYVHGARTAINSVPTTNKCLETKVANNLLTKAEILLPKPTINDIIDIDGLLSLDLKERALAQKELETKWSQDVLREQKIYSLEEKIEVLNKKIEQIAEKAEKENNSNILKRFWAWTLGTLGIGGIIALCIFFPALIPILISLARTIISGFASLCVMIVPSFKRVIQGIGNARETLRHEMEANKSIQDPSSKITYTPEEVLELLDSSLKESTDEKDKRLINKIREKVKV